MVSVLIFHHSTFTCCLMGFLFIYFCSSFLALKRIPILEQYHLPEIFSRMLFRTWQCPGKTKTFNYITFRNIYGIWKMVSERKHFRLWYFQISRAAYLSWNSFLYFLVRNSFSTNPLIRLQVIINKSLVKRIGFLKRDF